MSRRPTPSNPNSGNSINMNEATARSNMLTKNSLHPSESISAVDMTALPNGAARTLPFGINKDDSSTTATEEAKPLVGGADAQEDTKKDDAPSAASSGITATGLKVLVLLAVQNCSKNLLLRFVMKEHPKFLTSAAILGVETVKLVLSLLYIVLVQRRPATSAITFIKQDKRNTILMCVPATLYSIQMTLEYIALGSIDASVFSVLVQTKMLATAGCAVFILGKRIKKVQLISLVLLTIGVMLCNMKNFGKKAEEGGEETENSTKGILATLGIAACSGFASVYTEKVIKAKRNIKGGGTKDGELPSQQQQQQAPEPKKNEWGLAYTQVQLAFVSLVIMGFYCIVMELDEIMEKGLWYGFNGPAFISIFVSAIGGLIVAAGKFEWHVFFTFLDRKRVSYTVSIDHPQC